MPGELKKELSLEEFIKDNDKLLSVIGIFTAVTALTASSSNVLLIFIAFLSIAGLLLVGYEIFRKLNKNLSPALWIFRYILLWSGIAFILYWLYEFRIIWDMILWLPLSLVIFIFIVWSGYPIIAKISWIKKIFGINITSKNWSQKMFSFILIGIIIYISFTTGLIMSHGTNTVLNFIKH